MAKSIKLKQNYCIYGIVDPRSDVYVYIGSTVNPRKRFRSHLASSDSVGGNLLIKGFIEELHTAGRSPQFIVLQCSFGTSFDRKRDEDIWIDKFKPRFNINSAGPVFTSDSVKRPVIYDNRIEGSEVSKLVLEYGGDVGRIISDIGKMLGVSEQKANERIVKILIKKA